MTQKNHVTLKCHQFLCMKCGHANLRAVGATKPELLTLWPCSESLLTLGRLATWSPRGQPAQGQQAGHLGRLATWSPRERCACRLVAVLRWELSVHAAPTLARRAGQLTLDCSLSAGLTCSSSPSV